LFDIAAALPDVMTFTAASRHHSGLFFLLFCLFTAHCCMRRYSFIINFGADQGKMNPDQFFTVMRSHIAVFRMQSSIPADRRPLQKSESGFNATLFVLLKSFQVPCHVAQTPY